MSSAIRSYTRTVSANEVTIFHVPGSVVRCTSAAADFEVRPNGKDPATLRQGMGLNYAAGFDSLTIANGSTAQTIEIYIGDGEIADSRLAGSINAEIVSAGANSAPASLTVGVAAVTAFAANTYRKAALMKSDAANGGTIWILDDTASATGYGIPLAPGETMTIETTAAIKAIASAAGQTLHRYETSTQ